MTRTFILTFLVAALAGCALSDEPGSGTKTVPQGLSVLKATDTSISLAYRKADTVIFMRAMIGQKTPDAYQQNEGSPKFEVDARFDADNGRTFYTRKGGDQWLDPSWPADLERQNDLHPTNVSNESLFRLAAEATVDLDTKVQGLIGPELTRKLGPALQAIREFGVTAVEVFTEQRTRLDGHLVETGLTPEEIRASEVAYGTGGGEDDTGHVFTANYYYIAVHDMAIYAIGKHSATRLYAWFGYWGAVHDACNHGDCAPTMGQKCFLQYYEAIDDYKPAWNFQNCATGYSWTSNDGHNCHDDTRLQMANFVYGWAGNGYQVWCNDGDGSADISVWPGDESGSPECNSNSTTGYNYPGFGFYYVAPPAAYVCTPGGDRLCPGEVLYAGQARTSADGRFYLAYQGDGNLVLYRTSDWRALWATYSNSAPGWTSMQGDGNLVVYNSSSQARWSSNTWAAGNPGYFLVVQSDGNVVMYDPYWVAKWSTGTWGY